MYVGTEGGFLSKTFDKHDIQKNESCKNQGGSEYAGGLMVFGMNIEKNLVTNSWEEVNQLQMITRSKYNILNHAIADGVNYTLYIHVNKWTLRSIQPVHKVLITE